MTKFNNIFRIPSGTSPELTNLLHHLLKRDSKDRIEFDDFFHHPFLIPPQPPRQQQQQKTTQQREAEGDEKKAMEQKNHPQQTNQKGKHVYYQVWGV